MYHVCMPFAGIRFCLRRQWGSHPLGLGWQKINILMHKSHVLFQSSQTILIIYVHMYHACLCTMCVWVSHSHCDGIIMKLFLTHFLLLYHSSMYIVHVHVHSRDPADEHVLCKITVSVKYEQSYPLTKCCTMQPWLSRPRLSGPLIIRTSWRPENALLHMRRRHGRWSFVGVITYWVMSYGPCRLGLG